MIPKGAAKWLFFVPLGLLACIAVMTLMTLFKPTAGSIFRNWPMIVVIALVAAWARSLTSGQLPWQRLRHVLPTAPKEPSRWDTASSTRNVHLFGAAIVMGFAGVIYWRLPVVEAADIPADLFFVQLGLATLLVLFVGLVATAFRKPGVMVLDDSVLTLSGRDEIAIPLSNIGGVVLRPKTDPFVAVLRLNDPPRDMALELGRLSLSPAAFAAELARRRPGIEISDSRPGAFAGEGVLATLSDGDPREIR